MLNFFRINDSYRLLVALLILASMSLPLVIDPPPMLISEIRNMTLDEAIWLGKIMYVHVCDQTPPLTAAVLGLAHGLFGQSLLAWRITALALLFAQAAWPSPFS